MPLCSLPATKTAGEKNSFSATKKAFDKHWTSGSYALNSLNIKDSLLWCRRRWVRGPDWAWILLRRYNFNWSQRQRRSLPIGESEARPNSIHQPVTFRQNSNENRRKTGDASNGHRWISTLYPERVRAAADWGWSGPARAAGWPRPPRWEERWAAARRGRTLDSAGTSAGRRIQQSSPRERRTTTLPSSWVLGGEDESLSKCNQTNKVEISRTTLTFFK